jgi:hypothetical protein
MSASSTALVPLQSRAPKIVQFATDGVAAVVRLEPLDRRLGTSAYAIRLASAQAHLFGRLIGVLPSGEAVELGDLAVAAGSIGSARLTVAAPRGGFRSMVLELRSEKLLLQIEAPRPPQPRRFHPLGVAAVGGLAAAVVAGGAAVALEVPQSPMLGVPGQAIAGAPVSVQYAVRGSGSASYTARYDDGTVFASGTLPGARGAIALDVPRDAANRTVWVAVAMRGWLGAAAGAASFAVVPPPVVPRPVIAKPRVVVVYRDRPAAPARAAAPAPAPSAAPAAPVRIASVGMLVVEGDAVAGAPLQLRVMPHRTAMTVTMQDASGTTVAERELAPGETRATLPLPARPDTYFLALRYDDDGGQQQTVVQPVRVSAPQSSSR